MNDQLLHDVAKRAHDNVWRAWISLFRFLKTGQFSKVNINVRAREALIDLFRVPTVCCYGLRQKLTILWISKLQNTTGFLLRNNRSIRGLKQPTLTHRTKQTLHSPGANPTISNQNNASYPAYNEIVTDSHRLRQLQSRMISNHIFSYQNHLVGSHVWGREHYSWSWKHHLETNFSWMSSE